MNVKSLVACIVCFLMSLTAGVAQSPEPFSLTIAAVHPEIKAGSEVTVNVTLTNNSNRAAEIRFTSPLCDYVVEVRNIAGELAPDTEVKSKSDCTNRGATGANAIGRLKPNESVRNTIPVTIFSDMSEPGEYSVQFMWKAPKEFGNVTIKSNTVKITVVP
jgi:uncharacterized membrane protein